MAIIFVPAAGDVEIPYTRTLYTKQPCIFERIAAEQREIIYTTLAAFLS